MIGCKKVELTNLNVVDVFMVTTVITTKKKKARDGVCSIYTCMHECTIIILSKK